MSVEIPRNSFRASILRGEKPPLVIEDKNRRLQGDGDALESVLVSRSETRRGNHREKDRHRLTGETATVRYDGQQHDVELVNLSSGGAMIRADFGPKLWDIIQLQLGDTFSLDAAVRWLKGDLIGLEFAHETQIEADPRERAEILLSVIKRSFDDQEIYLEALEDAAEAEPEEDLGSRDEKRHPLIWMGEVHYAHDSNPVRLRNVSEGGALVEVAVDYPVGAEVLLDLHAAGQFFASVMWSCGDQVGLRFTKLFDIKCLANARPEITPHSWTVPGFLDVAEDDSPWHTQWSRSSIAELHSELEGFLKR
ncbi:PilZ domain-containing protein [Sphingomonas sp. SM33]|uniref:PilZ domain-containing protein n=1 Tax=Sphingomonas telluris TaxID=2907998 RepID=A0ABS9VLL9_9SPHN|nr:PilZ domain-containing protein [Sphingomonas telluris]MCH8615618.1 PilZ domain-containing protein [Sphingomonas telluris]